MDGDLPDLSTVYHTGRRRSFEPHDPPAEPPDDCVDPGRWRLAYALHRAHRPAAQGRCACGQLHPCQGWRQAVTGLTGACAEVRGAPRPFALCDYDGDVMAYGMTLPDGSAVTVQWADGSHGSVGVWTSPAAPARLWDYAITWVDRPVSSRPPPR